MSLRGGENMTSRGSASLLTALFVSFLGVMLVDSTAVGLQPAEKPQAPRPIAVSTAAPASIARVIRVQNRPIEIVRRNAPTIVFTDDHAIAEDLASTQAQLRQFEAALSKDLANGDFQAPRTRRVVNASRRHLQESPADTLGSVRAELGRLKKALRADIANGEFHGPQTLADASKARSATYGTADAALANNAVAVSDDIWSLKMAIERDLHAHEFTAIETHFNIDGRRWKVR